MSPVLWLVSLGSVTCQGASLPAGPWRPALAGPALHLGSPLCAWTTQEGPKWGLPEGSHRSYWPMGTQASVSKRKVGVGRPGPPRKKSHPSLHPVYHWAPGPAFHEALCCAKEREAGAARRASGTAALPRPPHAVVGRGVPCQTQVTQWCGMGGPRPHPQLHGAAVTAGGLVGVLVGHA